MSLIDAARAVFVLRPSSPLPPALIRCSSQLCPLPDPVYEF